MRKSEYNFAEGEVLLLDKPYHWTSFDVVNKLRGGLKMKKIGHAGTLDPLATGLLIICTGKMTRQIDHFQGWEKEYTGTFILGKTTPSYDLETEFDSESPYAHITEEAVKEAAKGLTGPLSQIPPAHSAIKVGGQRAYKKARAGKEIIMEPRAVEVHTFEITAFSPPEVHFRIVCSKGTYIRSLARDLGEQLGTGAYLAALRRTRIGEKHVDDAIDPLVLMEHIKALANENI
ncbi:tRNA pseudouridine synthase B [Flammeovirgaceae bacterium 311]|nr:tRNA pseudouridine synthase B [Flammeovirgaceae bacterium 311]